MAATRSTTNAAEAPLTLGDRRQRHRGPAARFTEQRNVELTKRVREVEQRNMKHFDEEVLKLDHWSDDLKQGLEREIKELDKQIREARKVAALAASLNDKLEAQKLIRTLESTRKERRKRLFDAQDEIDSQRDELIARIEVQLGQKKSVTPLFTMRWHLSTDNGGGR